MAGATKRTTVCLTTVAVVFIVVIIILCVIPKPCKKGDPCYNEGEAKSGHAVHVIDYTTTSTSPTTETTPSEATKTVTDSSTSTAVSNATSTTESVVVSVTSTTPESSTSSSTESVIVSVSSSTTASPTSTPVSSESSSVTEIIVAEVSTTEPVFETSDLAGTTSVTRADNTTETVAVTETTEAVTETTEAVTETTEAETTIATTEEIPTTTEEYTLTYMAGRHCNTTACKRLAARMVDMMDNGDISPCTDFYQYSCGGVVDNPFLKPENPQYYADKAIREKLMSLDPDDPDLGAVKVFYDGCLKTSSQSVFERLANATKVFSALESLYNETSGLGNFNLTKTLTAMMKMHFTPLFDLTLDVDGDDPFNFALRLSLPTFNSPFGENLAHMVCVGEYNSELAAAKREGGIFNLDEQYDKYNQCVKKGKGLEARSTKMKEIVSTLDLIGDHTEVNLTQRLNQAIIDLEFFLHPIVEEFPEKSIFRLHNLEKKYETMTLAEVMALPGFDENIQWNTLVADLFGVENDPKDIKVQVYFKETLERIINYVNMNIGDASNIHTVFMMMWSEQLYNDIVDPPVATMGSPDYCLRVTKNLMHDFSSYIYLDSLGPRLDEYQKQINTMIRVTKQTAEEQLKRTFPASANNLLIEKLRKMTGETMDLQTSKNILAKSMSAVDITGDFIEDCRTLLLRYRKRLYSMYDKEPSSPEVMWNQFLLPYSNYGTYIYAINKFMIPYGAMAPPLFYGDDVPFYISFAGIGHMIAHELMHSFDGTGILYDGERRNAVKPQQSSYYVPHTECLSDQLTYPQLVNTTADLDTNFTLPHRLALNELLSDSAATRLAWETYISLRGRGGGNVNSRRRRSPDWYPRGARAKRQAAKFLPLTNTSEPKLPFLDLTPIQLYFLRTAQTQCSATSDIMFNVKEDEHLPSRLRVNMVLMNDPLFASAFECQAGSPMVAAEQCDFSLG
ncbi:endothelin-converting enzyme 2-like isoform X2 [Penaeus japonicus]|uniref:endothelin-converting enzyme 2-like isoform X2 n=1 Tax=Penaeus japonicus TaxID=27405 RepID=UPI001C717138|nr:endothelin-converting enzyme 2-like isoform X2 [Penaeus japonicus]